MKRERSKHREVPGCIPDGLKPVRRKAFSIEVNPWVESVLGLDKSISPRQAKSDLKKLLAFVRSHVKAAS